MQMIKDYLFMIGSSMALVGSVLTCDWLSVIKVYDHERTGISSAQEAEASQHEFLQHAFTHYIWFQHHALRHAKEKTSPVAAEHDVTEHAYRPESSNRRVSWWQPGM